MIVIYDGDCPICTSYVNYLRLKDVVSTVELIDARRAPEEVERLQQLGVSLDDGIVVEFGSARYHGAEAMHQLTLMTTRSGLVNRIMHWMFSSRKRARYAYPVLRSGRNFVLWLLKRPRITSV